MIPVYEPDLSIKEESYLLDAFRSGWISSKGRYVQEFEQEFANFIGSQSSGISVSNGTVALHLALLALGISNNDEVLVPNFTYIACANAVTYVGATPVFFNSNEIDLQPDLESAKSKITSKTKAIILPHLYGSAADSKGFQEFAKDKGIYLIEDCAEAIGTRLEGSHVGLLGDIATFSFFGNKTITTGEGGMVFSKDVNLDKQMRKLKNQGLSEPGSYHHDVVGFNYRMTNLQAAIGLAQTERLPEILSKKIANHASYAKALNQNQKIRLLEPIRGESSYWMETVILAEGMKADKLIENLKQMRIETRPGFSLNADLPMYAKSANQENLRFSLENRIINLPSSPLLKQEQIDYVCGVLSELCQQT